MSDVLSQQLEKLNHELKEIRPLIQARLLFLAEKLAALFKFKEAGISARVCCNLDRWPDWRKQPAPEGIITIEILNTAGESEMCFEIVVEKREAYLRPRLREDVSKAHQLKINYIRALALVAVHLADLEEVTLDLELIMLLEHESKVEQEIRKLGVLALKEEEHQHRWYIREVLDACNNSLKFKKPIDVYNEDHVKIKSVKAVQSIIHERECYFVHLVRSSKEVLRASLAWEELSRLCQLQEAQKE